MALATALVAVPAMEPEVELQTLEVMVVDLVPAMVHLESIELVMGVVVEVAAGLGME